MRIATLSASAGSRPVWVSRDGDRMKGVDADSWRDVLLEPGRFANERKEAERVPESEWMPLDVHLGPPIPDPSKIVAVGLNYRAHAEEQGKEPPKVPLLFAKAPSCLIGAGDPIAIPPKESQVDAEAELAVAIGRRIHRIGWEDAAAAILGYTIMNDVSGREAQYGDKQFFRGKSFDTFGPCGPWIVTADEIADPQALGIRAFWNGEKMQESSTGDMIHGVVDLVVYIAMQMTLMPGDLIATGTPSGVGVFRRPPVFLRSGDSVRIEIDRIGVLENPVVAS